MNIFSTKRANILSVTYLLLDQLDVKVNVSTLSKYLDSHPHYPSLLSICDCLTYFNVDNNVYKLEKENYSCSNLKLPFITHSNKDHGTFFIVKKVNDGHFLISDGGIMDIRVSEQDFFSSWEGIILYAQSSNDSGELNFYQNYIKSILKHITLPLFFGTLLSIIITISFSYPFNWIIFVLEIIKLGGVIITMLLLGYNINSSNSIINRLCGSSEKNGCNLILKSKDAKITTWLTWSELGFIYFFGSLLSLLLLPNLTPLLLWINFLSMPVSVYSLYFQFRRKIWCKLCCMVQALLFIEFILFNIICRVYNVNQILNFKFLFSFFLCFFFPVITWVLLKPIFLQAFSVKELQGQLNKFKYNSQIFTHILMNQNHYDLPVHLDCIILGDPESTNIITIVSNPYCEPCAQAHLFLEEWLQKRLNIQLKIILLVNTESQQVEVARHMIALSLYTDKIITMSALKEWYSQRNKVYKIWAEKFPVVIDDRAKSACVVQNNWCTMAGIVFTPTIFINGYILPEQYLIEDLQYIIN